MLNRSVLIIGLFDTSIMTARCFKGTGVNIYGMDYNEDNYGFNSRIIKGIKTPNPKVDENNWLQFIVEWMNKSGKQFILFPTSDEFVELIARYYTELSEYADILLPGYDSIKIILERDLQFKAAKMCSLDVPYFINGSAAINEELGIRLHFPLAVKPVNAIEWKKYFNHKGFIVANENELLNIIRELEEKRARYLIQNMIQGENTLNYEVNSLYLPNGTQIQHTIKKLRQYPDQFGTATCIESCANSELEEFAATYIEKLNLLGFTNMEFKFNQLDNKYYYIETNPRVWLQVNYSMECGINFPVLYFNYLTGNSSSFSYALNRNGKWVDILPDLLFWKKYRKRYMLSLFDLIKSWFPLISTGLFSFNDPLPFIKDLKINKTIRKIFAKVN
jgi:D-aspartate ligase